MNREHVFEIIKYRPKTLMVIVLLVVLNLLVFARVQFHQEPALAEARQRWTERRKSAAADDPRVITAKLARDKADIASFMKHIPPKSELPAVLGEIFQTIADNGLSAESVSYRPQSMPERKVLAYTVTMKFAGSYQKLKYLLDDFQRSNGMLLVDTYHFSRPSDADGDLELNLDLVFYLKEDGP